jgi:hypothetical protein
MQKWHAMGYGQESTVQRAWMEEALACKEVVQVPKNWAWAGVQECMVGEQEAS